MALSKHEAFRRLARALVLYGRREDWLLLLSLAATPMTIITDFTDETLPCPALEHSQVWNGVTDAIFFDAAVHALLDTWQEGNAGWIVPFITLLQAPQQVARQWAQAKYPAVRAESLSGSLPVDEGWFRGVVVKMVTLAQTLRDRASLEAVLRFGVDPVTWQNREHILMHLLMTAWRTQHSQYVADAIQFAQEGTLTTHLDDGQQTLYSIQNGAVVQAWNLAVRGLLLPDDAWVKLVVAHGTKKLHPTPVVSVTPRPALYLLQESAVHLYRTKRTPLATLIALFVTDEAYALQWATDFFATHA